MSEMHVLIEMMQEQAESLRQQADRIDQAVALMRNGSAPVESMMAAAESKPKRGGWQRLPAERRKDEILVLMSDRSERTNAEIARRLGFSSDTSVRKYTHDLEAQGRLRIVRRRGHARVYSLV